jgi:tRNA-Thr(GGU) m(6)t(6)A37 methyltransferase TsaA
MIPLEPIVLQPIGVVRSPLVERSDAERQASAAPDVTGRIELRPDLGLEHAISDLEAWQFIWVMFVFHKNVGAQGSDWKPKVLPPRSERRRGVLATRSPHRPNPIGLSAVRLVAVEGLTLTVAGLDILDGSPVLDIKPYVAYADAIPDAGAGWMAEGLAADPAPKWEVELSAMARAMCEFVRQASGLDLAAALTRTLSLGPQPHPYRRIRLSEGRGRIAHKSWRATFRVEGRRIVVDAIASGYRPKELVANLDRALDAHRRFVERFGADGGRGAISG